MTGSLDGKVAVVTGAGRGLGRAMAEALAGAGAAVVVAGRRTADLEDCAAKLNAEGGRAQAVRCDVTSESDVAELAETAVASFGRVDILVNNSGVVETTTLVEQEPESWDRIVDTNLRGVYLTTRAIGRRFVAQGSGKVVNIASNFGLMGVSHHAAYSSSKAAVIAFTRSMAVEWARHNVQVNAIAPGYFATDINAGLRADDAATAAVLKRIPARRMGRPEELAPWLLLLAGPASDFMTGETLVVDGGQSIQ
ncbi:SDR family NAD(P)-dependent oxidoreductase [Amycolatopsis orientalis]|uniref:SDR family NAD(P)-dependent oxidoreductase n=1 Tax=Amycolatopsis orientalis TaxID=31958 RepID=UPI000559BF53|nr:glucose 1-dehydrogenase [Amycolatopsis orientalis]